MTLAEMGETGDSPQYPLLLTTLALGPVFPLHQLLSLFPYCEQEAGFTRVWVSQAQDMLVKMSLWPCCVIWPDSEL